MKIFCGQILFSSYGYFKNSGWQCKILSESNKHFCSSSLYCVLKLYFMPGVVQPFWNFNWAFLPALSSSTGKCFSPVRRNSDFLVLCTTFWGLPEVCFPSWSYKFSFPLMQKSRSFPLQALKAGRSAGLMALPWWQAGNGAKGGGEEWTCVPSLGQLYFQVTYTIEFLNTSWTKCVTFFVVFLVTSLSCSVLLTNLKETKNTW